MDKERENSVWFNGLAWGTVTTVVVIFALFSLAPSPPTIEDGMIKCKMEADHCDRVWQVFVAEQELEKLKEQLK